MVARDGKLYFRKSGLKLMLRKIVKLNFMFASYIQGKFHARCINSLSYKGQFPGNVRRMPHLTSLLFSCLLFPEIKRCLTFDVVKQKISSTFKKLPQTFFTKCK